MTQLYKNKYRIASARRPNWDYGWPGAYFITICTKGRECSFGRVAQGEMHLSAIGEIVQREWVRTPDIRPDMALQLDAWVVMPNHFHAILLIGDNEYNTAPVGGGGTDIGRDGGRDAMHRVSTVGNAGRSATTGTVPDAGTTTNVDTNARGGRDAIHRVSTNTFSPQSKNLGSIIRGFKSAVTTQARRIDPAFAWQPRFHDHIIRDNGAYERIADYILNNTPKWDVDKFNPNNE